MTETALLHDIEGVALVLEAIRALGVELDLDDFGTGYSSLLHLKLFPVDRLKIDRSFVAGLGTNTADTAIVASMIALAHSIGVSVVAEGVETAGQLALLRSMGCDLAQGYLFSRPLSEEALTAWLGTHDPSSFETFGVQALQPGASPALLERLRQRAMDDRHAAADVRDLIGDERDDAGERRDAAGNERDSGADAREMEGDRRDEVGDRRDGLADERDLLADTRDLAADDRDHAADGGIGDDQPLESYAERSETSSDRQGLAIARDAAATDRSAALEERAAGARRRLEAGREREHASTHRDEGTSERLDAERARGRAASERLSAGPAGGAAPAGAPAAEDQESSP